VELTKMRNVLPNWAMILHLSSHFQRSLINSKYDLICSSMEVLN
jgi:hypothetical protein